MSHSNDNILAKVIDLTENYHFSVKRNIYRETLRQLLNVFGNIYYLDGSNTRTKVKCTTGKPDRATGKDANENNLVLPYITISEIGSEEADGRRRVHNLLVNEKIWDAKENRAKRYLSLAPKAININYEINIWAKYNADLDQIRYSIFSLFHPSLEIRTNFSDFTKAFVKNESDISSPQAGDTTDRLIQKTISISVETYLPSPKFLYTNTGEIKSFNAEVTLVDTRASVTEDVEGNNVRVIEVDSTAGESGPSRTLTLSGSLVDVDITSVTFGDVLLWNGDYWVASAISDIIGGETLNHQLLSNRGALDAHPQYVLSSTNLSLSSAVSSHIASASVHFTSGSLSGAYVLTSTNSNLSSLVSNIQASTISLSSYIAANEPSWLTGGVTTHNQLAGLSANDHPQYASSSVSAEIQSVSAYASGLSSIVSSHLTSAVHWELSTLNTNYLNASGDSANAGFYLSSVSATNISATNYYNLPSATLVWPEAQDIVLLVRNGTGAPLSIGTPVTITGSQGDVPIVAILSAVNTHVPEAYGFANHVAGLVRTSIGPNQNGYITVEGLIEGGIIEDVNLNTSLFAAGDSLYVSSNGQLTNVRPPAPYESHPVGIVIRPGTGTNGKILVKIENSPEVNDIVGFNLNPNILNGDIISYDLTTSTFVNKQTINVSGLGRFGSVSATTYENLPSSTALWNANQLQGRNVSSNAPGLYQVLTYDGSGWVPSSVPTGGGGTNDHAALINRELDNAHPQYASSSVSAQINSVSAYASGVSSIVSSHINDSTIHFTSGSLSGAYVLTSTNTNLSSLVTDIQTSSNNLSGVVGAHIGSAVHWDLSTLNSNYINASGDSASAGFYFSSLSATRFAFTSSIATVTPITGTVLSTQTAPLIRVFDTGGNEFFRLTARASNIHIGYQAGFSNGATGDRNTSLGSNTATNNTSGSDNTSLGYLSLSQNRGGSFNTAIGSESLHTLSGSYNIGLGYRSGFGLSGPGLQGPNNNIVIGVSSNAVAPVNYSNTIVIGSGTTSTADNQTIIGHPQTSSTILRGTVSSTSLISNVISGTNISGAIVSATTVSAGTLHLGGSDGYLINNNGSIIISAINGTVRFPQGFELTGTVSAPTISATTYLNLPTSSLSGLADTQITSPINGQSLIWSSTISKWIASSVAGGAGPGGVTDHGALTGLEDNDHPQYASSSVSAQIESVSAYASGVSSIVSSHINDSTIHFTSGSLSGYYAASAWTEGRYVLTSTNNTLSSLVSDIQTSSNNLSGVVGAHIGSAVHWDLDTLNANYLNASGDSVNASFYLSGLSATNFSATTYQNLPSGSPVWNANQLQSRSINSTAPDLSAVFVYNGTEWTPGYSIFISSTAPDNAVGGNGDLYFEYGTNAYVLSSTNLNLSTTVSNHISSAVHWDLATLNANYINASGDSVTAANFQFGNISAISISATTYKNLPTSSLSGLADTQIASPTNGQSLVWSSTVSKWIPSSVGGGGGGATPYGGIANPPYEIQFYKDGGLSSLSGFIWHPDLFGGRIVVSSPLAGLSVYGSIYSDYLGMSNFTLYGNNTSQDIKISPASALSASKFEIENLSATTLSAATYLNLPVSSHNQLTNLNANDHPQYVLSSTNNTLSSLVSNIQTSSNNLSGVVGSHIASSDVHFTSGSLSGYYAASSWVNSNYSPTSHNHSFSALSGLSDVNIPPNPVNDNVLTWSSTAPGGGKWVAKSFAAAAAKNLYELEDVDSTTVPPADDPFNTDSILRWNSAGGPSNLGIWEGITAADWFTNTQSSITHNSIGGLTTGDPHTQYALKSLSSTAYWNANKLQGTDVTSTAPTTGQTLVYDGAKWTPSSLPTPGAATAGTLILINANETSVTGTTDNLTAKSYTVGSNSYSKIIIESEISFRSQANISCDVDFILSVTGVSKKTVKLEGDQTGTGDQFAMGGVLKWSEQLTGGGEVKIGADVIVGAGTWTVQSLRVYGVV